jgi:hypothetical protein
VNDALPDGASALIVAAHSGHRQVATLLLDKGANPNANGIGYTALHAAVLKSDLELVKALLAHGAKPDSQMTRGTPVRRNSQDFECPRRYRRHAVSAGGQVSRADIYARARCRRSGHACTNEGWRDAAHGCGGAWASCRPRRTKSAAPTGAGWLFSTAASPNGKAECSTR